MCGHCLSRIIRRVEHRSTRETILGLLLHFGFSLANLSLVRHHRPALHDPFHLEMGDRRNVF